MWFEMRSSGPKMHQPLAADCDAGIPVVCCPPMLAMFADNDTALLLTEEVLVLATIVGSIAAMPPLIEFISERRKLRHRLSLTLEDVPVNSLRPRLAGLDHLLESIADLIDRARTPSAYPDLRIGNEVLIIGPNQSGKKSLAQRIAQMAGIERLVTVYNPRDSEALAKAKQIVRGYKRRKVMLLLPRIDLAYQMGDPQLLAELDALIETTTDQENVLVVATTVWFAPDSDLDNVFGIKIALPGAGINPADRPEIGDEAARMLAAVTEFYLSQARSRGFQMEGISAAEFSSRILEVAVNPAEIEDIVVLCQTTALFRQRTRRTTGKFFTREILETAIARVIAR
jgi:hypothetical protein